MPGLTRTLFIALAPLSVPAYLLWLAYVNLSGMAWFVVWEMTIQRLIGRPARIGRTPYWALSPLVIAAAALALAGHLVIGSLRGLAAGAAAIGRWQTGLRTAWPCFVLGLAWTVLLAWGLMVCVDGTSAFRIIAREINGRKEFSTALRRNLRLGDLPAAMRERRAEILAELERHPNQESAQFVTSYLRPDDELFATLPEVLQFRIAGLPWYFVPAEASFDGAAHCRFLGGTLLLLLLLLIRWPGVSRSAGPWQPWGVVSFLVRMAAAMAALAYVLTWKPGTIFPTDGPTEAFPAGLAPLRWLGVESSGIAPPEWLTLNIALWLGAVGLVIGFCRLAGGLSGSLGVPRFYSVFLAARLLQRKRIAFFSIGAVTLCVAMLLIVISVMGGFVDTIRDRAKGLLGDLVMDGGLRGFPYYAGFVDRLRQLPEVEQATALVYTFGTLRLPTGETKPVQIWGITLSEYCGVNEFCKNLYYEPHYPGTSSLGPSQMPTYGLEPVTGRAILPEPFESARRTWLEAQPPEVREEFTSNATGAFPGPGVFEFTAAADYKPALTGKPYPGVIIGRDIIAYRTASGEYRRKEAYARGCAVVLTMLPLSRSGGVSTESPPAPAFRYVDDSRTGIYEIDSKNVYVAFDVLQEKLNMNALPRAEGEGVVQPRASQIQIKLRPGVDAVAMKGRVEDAWADFCEGLSPLPDAEDAQMLRYVQVSTWEELQASFINAIKKEKVLVVVMFGVISLVAVFLILCIFYMIVLEKTRDIGIIKSVGGSAEGVAAIFLTYGAAIGIVGSVLGSAVGYAFVVRINAIQDWLARLNPEWRIWSPETYSFDKIPDVVKPSDMVVIAIAAVLASVIGAVAPAMRAARTWPVEALRYE